MTRLQRVNSAVVSGNPETTADIATPPKSGSIHSKDRSLPSGGTTWRVVCTIRVCGDSPYRVRALEREKSLGNVGLDERYTTRFSYKRDELKAMYQTIMLEWDLFRVK